MQDLATLFPMNKKSEQENVIFTFILFIEKQNLQSALFWDLTVRLNAGFVMIVQTNKNTLSWRLQCWIKASLLVFWSLSPLSWLYPPASMLPTRCSAPNPTRSTALTLAVGSCLTRASGALARPCFPLWSPCVVNTVVRDAWVHECSPHLCELSGETSNEANANYFC